MNSTSKGDRTRSRIGIREKALQIQTIRVQGIKIGDQQAVTVIERDWFRV